jgi:hypothetical protein
MRWMDRDRLRAGTAVVREVSASRKAESLGLTDKIHGNRMMHDDVRTFGPLLVYNGVPISDPNLRHENVSARKAFASKYSRIPEDKIVIIDELNDADGNKTPLRHTGDQVKSLFQNLQDDKSPLYGIKNVALISHFAHFIRIPFYLKKYEDEFVRNGGYRLNYYTYALKGRPGVIEHDVEWEIPRLLEYAAKGDLDNELVILNM